MFLKAVVNVKFALICFLSLWISETYAQSKSLLVCMVPTIVDEAKFNELLSISPRNFKVDNEKIVEINYIDSLLKLSFQSPIEIVDGSFILADSCLQFMRKGGGGGVSSYYAYSQGVVKDKDGNDVIEMFLHYRNIVPHNKKGEQKLGISFYRLIDDRILQDPIIRLHTFNKTYEVAL